MNKEQMKQFILNNDVEKYPLLNEIFAIRDTRKEQVDYTIYVDGYISVDVLNKALEQQAEIEKKDKIIDLILETNAGLRCLNIYCKKRKKKDKCIECVKEYYINKIEKGE